MGGVHNETISANRLVAGYWSLTSLTITEMISDNQEILEIYIISSGI